jgi:hypothetical protein
VQTFLFFVSIDIGYLAFVEVDAGVSEVFIGVGNISDPE